jgi:cobalt/nickel transport system permease protein
MPLLPLFAMHIPDGFLSLPVAGAMGLIALVLAFVALRRVEGTLSDRLVPLMGVNAAFVFAAQMVNFPVAGGTSGHLIGGTLAAILLGPWAGSLSIMVVFAVQALLFQDGGITALGANVLNMGFVGTFLGYWLYRAVRALLGDRGWFALAVAAGVASWASVMAASGLAALELACSGTVALPTVLGAMIAVHALIGIGEAVLTVGVTGFLWRTRPDLLFGLPPGKDVPHRSGPAQTLQPEESMHGR